MRFSLSSALLLFAVSSQAACLTSTDSTSEGELASVSASNEVAALTRALDSVKAEDIKADLYFIASDELQGRDTPSQGLRIAARFVRARLERLGWQPGASDGYLYEYSLQNKRIDTQTTRARLVGEDRTIELQVGTDYVFSSRGLRYQDREEPLVYCGTASEVEMGDLDLTGKMALVSVSEDGKWWQSSSRVKKAGASELIWISAAGESDNPFGERWAEWMTDMKTGKTGWPAKRSENPPFTTASLTNARATELFELAGFDAERPAAGTELPVRFHDVRSIDPDSPNIPIENVAGFWPGGDPELKNEVIILSAHYDHVGVSEGEIYNGADDNGSGTCALLALAEALVENGPMRRSVMLLWVSGEEKGLLGSRAWAESPWLPEGTRAICNINIDMVGRNAPDSLLITPTKDHEKYNQLTKLAESLRESEGFAELGSADQYYHRSDHAMFEEHMGLPVCFLFSDVHEDYHKPTDTVEKVDYDKIRRVTRLVLKMINGLQTDTLSF
ncbi:MAG: hypothetical protein ACI8TQ_002206 [Planctomycetota bacterium]|jgi:hypothetical protein